MDNQDDQNQPMRDLNDLENDVRSSGPMTREQLVDEAWEHGAPEGVRAAVEKLPEGKYYNAQQVDDALRTGTGPQDEGDQG